MFFVILAWVLFRAINIDSAYEYVKVMFVANGASSDYFWLYWSNYRFYIILGLILSFKWESLFVNKNEEASPRKVGKLASDSSTEGADCEAISDRKILNSPSYQSLDCHANKSVCNNDYSKDFCQRHSNQSRPYQPHLISDFLEILGFVTLFFIVICYVVRGGYNPFIYFNF